MVSDKNLANAVGGKTARACDSCIRKRARWYCAADDAFLCQACDASVHSANPLARRHERVRLKTASMKPSLEPSWYHGFTRKARTPRQGKHRQAKSEDLTRNTLHLVPEIGPDENSYEENDEQLLYRVPIFDPFAAELRISNEGATTVENYGEVKDGGETDKCKTILNDCASNNDVNSLHGFYPFDMDLEEFAADVGSLLGKGLDEESFDMETLGFFDSMEGSSMSGIVKLEEEEGQMEAIMGSYQIDAEVDMTREPFELNFDYDSPANYEEDDNAGVGDTTHVKEREKYEVENVKKKKILLTLDYEGVIAAWAHQKFPWTTGDRPEMDPNDSWPYYMGGCCGRVHYSYGDMGGHTAMLDGGREAKVSRYREKRRKRLFSKKIRYEVRKLNAEKRPRMKGRFVKRANSAASPFPLLSKY